MSMARPTTTDGEPAHAPRGEGRLRQAWRAAHEPAAGVPRWARRVACTVPLVVLPSGICRLLLRRLRPPGPVGPDARRPHVRVLAPAWVGPGASLLSAAPKGVQGDRPRARRS